MLRIYSRLMDRFYSLYKSSADSLLYGMKASCFQAQQSPMTGSGLKAKTIVSIFVSTFGLLMLEPNHPPFPVSNPAFCSVDEQQWLLAFEDQGTAQVTRTFDGGGHWQGPIVVGGGTQQPMQWREATSSSIKLVRTFLDGEQTEITLNLACDSIRVQRIDVSIPDRDSAVVGEDGAIVCPATAESPRNTEASVVQLNSGELLLAYSRFYAGFKDHSWGDISARISKDEGRTWGRPFVLIPNEGEMNTMSVSLLRLSSGKLLIGYARKNSFEDCRYYIRVSSDEGLSWGDPILVTAPKGYYVVNNDRMIQTSNGRLIVPVADHGPAWTKEQPPGLATCFYSDDDGMTWKRSETNIALPAAGCREPGVVEVKGGHLLMVIRTTLGQIYVAKSVDAGRSWSQALPSKLPSPDSPSTIKRLPTGDLLLIWNRNKGTSRTPLNSAISRDEGVSWTNIRTLETPLDQAAYAYTSVTFVDDTAVLTYYRWKSNRAGLKVRRLPIQWFYNPEPVDLIGPNQPANSPS